ncbi:RnfABCDGE type electron transport complex subunit G [Anaerobium acetethylicum]|uniref:Ion-translocating oxidoreductase complex subunit G n=1 Tax=Anaerobium acetethylicum TaxID=1619234 RepID=A0A1D3TP10_9FIRM|nr:RnfABCDGE type electron transport complex subunit G [Anaerobium acetethylicum]SCP95093.1 electron transport complex protein RnfG [Anaerobium acetethylicum]
MNKIVKDALMLALITLVAGFLLGTIYEITKEPIKKQQELAKQESYKAVFKDASGFEASDADLADAASILAENGYGKEAIEEVMEAVNENGETLGYVMSVITNEGYAGEIKIAMGIQNDGTVNGIEILKISETAGLGMKAADSEFKDQYGNKNVEKFVYTKSGAASDEEIDVISGATITTNAVTNAVNSGICFFNSIAEGGAENE